MTPPAPPERLAPFNDPKRDASWAEHLIYMEAGAELRDSAPETGDASRRAGLTVCAVLAFLVMTAEFVGKAAFELQLLDATMLAMLLGLVAGNSSLANDAWRPGTLWILKVVVPAGGVLLGARLNSTDLLSIGSRGLALAAAVIAISAFALYLCFRSGFIGARLATSLARSRCLSLKYSCIPVGWARCVERSIQLMDRWPGFLPVRATA